MLETFLWICHEFSTVSVRYNVAIERATLIKSSWSADCVSTASIFTYEAPSCLSLRCCWYISQRWSSVQQRKTIEL